MIDFDAVASGGFRTIEVCVGARERDEWLWCMDRAIAEHPMPDALRTQLRERLHALALPIVRTDG